MTYESVAPIPSCIGQSNISFLSRSTNYPLCLPQHESEFSQWKILESVLISWIYQVTEGQSSNFSALNAPVMVR